MLVRKHQKGFSTVELLVAAGISVFVVLGAFQAFKYFNSNTKKEVAQLGTLGEFNTLAKELLKFSEGAGISTSYLNLPIKIKGCTDTEPCVRKLVGEKFMAPSDEEIPKLMRESGTCTQFYKEGRGTLVSKKAYPNLALGDMLFGIKEQDLKLDSSVDLYSHWMLNSPASPPFLMLSLKEGGMVLNMLRKQVEISREENQDGTPNLQYAFFDTTARPEQLKGLIGSPFVIFNSVFSSHFTIQYVQDLKKCSEDTAGCLAMINSIPQVKPVTDLSALGDADTPVNPDQIYAIQFKPIAFDGADEKKITVADAAGNAVEVGFFSRITNAQNLPADCLSSWTSDTRQTQQEYFFPTKVYSVANSDPHHDLAGTDPLSVLHLNHYYTSTNVLTSLAKPLSKGVMLAMPIKISTYSIERNPQAKELQVISHEWHATEIRRQIKIKTLKGTFSITRKVGTGEVGIWYDAFSKEKLTE